MKKLLKITLALMMALCLQLTSFNSVHALNNDLSKAEHIKFQSKV